MINTSKPTTTLTNVAKPTTTLANATKIGVFTGQATLIAGTKTVTNTSVKAIDNILLTLSSAGGTPGTLSISAITPGVSFVILSSSGSDTSVVNWQFIQ